MVDYNGYYEDLCSDEVWTYLDSIATHLAGSGLQRVDVDVSFNYENTYVKASESALVSIIDELKKGAFYSLGIANIIHGHGVGGQC